MRVNLLVFKHRRVPKYLMHKWKETQRHIRVTNLFRLVSVVLDRARHLLADHRRPSTTTMATTTTTTTTTILDDDDDEADPIYV
eukprot:3947328-Pyramimonas_sp.AAC.1